MSPLVASFNFYLALGAIAAVLFAIILFVDERRDRALAPLIKAYGLLAALFVSAGSMVVAYTYSDVFGFTPCGYCWLARIFLFPQVFMLLGAIYFKDALVARYGIILSSIGLVITLYNHYLQIGGSAFIKCPAAGATDCAKRIFYEFDFITFPLAAAAGFVLLIALYYYILRVSR